MTMLTSVVISGAQQGNRTFCKNGLLLTSRLSLREAPLVEKAKHVFFLGKVMGHHKCALGSVSFVITRGRERTYLQWLPTFFPKHSTEI